MVSVRDPIKACLFGVAALAVWAANAGESLYDWPYRFTDQSGTPTTLAAWRGRTPLVTMDHTGNIVVCSRTSRRLRSLQQSADRRGMPVEIVVISLDPANDTADAWQRYLKALGIPDATWRLLRPAPGDVPDIARRLGIRHWREDDYLIHDLRIVRLDAQGRIAKAMDAYERSNDRLLR